MLHGEHYTNDVPQSHDLGTIPGNGDIVTHCILLHPLCIVHHIMGSSSLIFIGDNLKNIFQKMKIMLCGPFVVCILLDSA